MKSSIDLLTPINGRSINWTPSERLRISLRGITPFKKKLATKLKSPSNLYEKSLINWSDLEKKCDKPFKFLKSSKDLLTPINGKSINWTPSEILRISLRGIKLYLNVLEYTFEQANRKIPSSQTHMSECLNQKRNRGFQTRRLTGKKKKLYETNIFF